MTIIEKCIKCKHDASVHIRRTWYCEKCYLDLLKLKFDTAMGQSVTKKMNAKVLICLDDGQSSEMLLDLSKKYCEESSLLMYKKRSFYMIDLVVGRLSDSPCPSNESMIHIDPEELTFLKSETSKEDAKQIMKFQMFVDLAIEKE